MINWNEMSELHVVNKLESILKRWFNVELFFCDLNGKVHSKQFQKGYVSGNPIFKLILQASHGYDIFLQDVESMLEEGKDSDGSYFYTSKVNSLSFCASPVNVDGQVVGYSFVYPFFSEMMNEQDVSLCSEQLQELGVGSNDINSAISSLPKISKENIEYLRELISLVTGEISTYHYEISKREERIRDLNSELGDRYRYHTMIGKSKQMQKIYRLLEKISSSDSSVFVQGENGTGKELVAKAIHFYSPRKDSR